MMEIRIVRAISVCAFHFFQSFPALPTTRGIPAGNPEVINQAGEAGGKKEFQSVARACGGVDLVYFVF